MTATPVYCDNTDVKRILQVPFTFSSTSTPTLDEVNEAIIAAEDQINQETQHSWKTASIINEFYDFPTSRRGNTSFRQDWTFGIPIMLRHRDIKDLTTATPDKIEIWNGSSYDDWVATKTPGRGNDWWIDNEQGILYIKKFLPFFVEKGIRMTYRYGESGVPNDIRDATATIAAVQFLESDDRSSMLNETGDPTRLSFADRISRMLSRVKKILNNRREISVI